MSDSLFQSFGRLVHVEHQLQGIRVVERITGEVIDRYVEQGGELLERNL